MNLCYFNIIMFLFILFLAYSSFMFDIVLIDNKFRHMFVDVDIFFWTPIFGHVFGS